MAPNQVETACFLYTPPPHQGCIHSTCHHPLCATCLWSIARELHLASLNGNTGLLAMATDLFTYPGPAAACIYSGMSREERHKFLNAMCTVVYHCGLCSQSFTTPSLYLPHAASMGLHGWASTHNTASWPAVSAASAAPCGFDASLGPDGKFAAVLPAAMLPPLPAACPVPASNTCSTCGIDTNTRACVEHARDNGDCRGP